MASVDSVAPSAPESSRAPGVLAIEARDLAKTYSGGVQALAGVSFSVRPGEVFALLGPNGAGKSTTVKILTTLSEPSGGSGRVFGFDVVRDAREVRRRIGCVAQASGVDFAATGRENLELQGRLFRLPVPELKSRIDELLELFALADAAHRPTRTYSGGMKRRLDVAMGLVHRPEVLFLDEPTTGLDPESRAVLWREVRRLAAGGLTLLLTTHYLEEADQLADRLAIVDQGRIVAEGTPDGLKAELAGDRISLQLVEPAESAEARRLLGDLPGVTGVLADASRADRVYAHVLDGARELPAVLGALERAGIAVAGVALSRPSLDDVYLKATGHAYQES